MKEIEVGRVADYFKKIGGIAIKITAGEIRLGDTLYTSPTAFSTSAYPLPPIPAQV